MKFLSKFKKSFEVQTYKAIRGESKSGRCKQSKTNFKKHNLKGQGIDGIIIPSDINDIYTRLEILLVLKLSGHTDTLTESSNLIDELYKRREMQNKQQYRNASNNFHIITYKYKGNYTTDIFTITRVFLHS